MEQLVLRINPNGVAAPAQQVAMAAAHVVSTCLDALAGLELTEPRHVSETMGYRFSGPEMTSENRRAAYQNWLLAMGFQDLLRGVRQSLEEAILYLSIAREPPRETTWAQVEREIEEIRKRASGLNFPTLLSEVHSGLTEPMALDAEFLTMQRARNCMEHRGGIVGAKDADEDEATLTLSLPRLKLYYLREGQEIELVPGHVIDTGPEKVPARVKMRRVNRVKSYAMGERITLTSAEFHESAMACFLFAGDLASKLPIVHQPKPEGQSATEKRPDHVRDQSSEAAECRADVAPIENRPPRRPKPRARSQAD